MLIVLIASLLKRLFLSIKKVAIATTATELITSHMKFAWRIKKKTRNYICECPFTKGTYYFIDWNFSQHLDRVVDQTFIHQSAYVAWLDCDRINLIWLSILQSDL